MRYLTPACVLLAFLVPFASPLPVGIDMPHHAQMLRMFEALLFRTDPGYQYFFDLNLKTPYILTYLLAVVVSMATSPIFAVKFMMALTTLALPFAIRQWQQAVHGDPLMSITAYFGLFGFGYYWGFLSFQLAIAIGFLFLAVVEPPRSGSAYSWKRSGSLMTLSLLLFACHAFVFIFFVAIAAGRLLQTQRFVSRATAGLLPGGALFLFWLLNRSPAKGIDTNLTFCLHPMRFLTFFSSWFDAHVSTTATVGGAVMCALLLMTGKPQLQKNSPYLVPVAGALAGLFFLPTELLNTWAVGERFTTLLQLFLPLSLVAYGTGWMRRHREIFVPTLVLIFLLLQVARASYFRNEVSDLLEIAKTLPPGSDIASTVMHNNPDSPSLGYWHLAHSAGWITAQNGGILENDSATYFQMPVLRRGDILRPTSYHYVLSRGSMREAKLLGQDYTLEWDYSIRGFDPWILFDVKIPRRLGDLEIIRFAGEIEFHPERSFLSTGSSVLQLRLPDKDGLLRGKAAALSAASATAFIERADRTILWSGEIPQGEERSFSIPITKGHDLFLRTKTEGATTWLLELVPTL